MVSRRNLLKGAGAFVAAGASYQQTSAGILLPKQDLITVQPENSGIILDGIASHMDIEQVANIHMISSIGHCDSNYFPRYAPGTTEVTLFLEMKVSKIVSFTPDLLPNPGQPLRVYIVGREDL